MIPEFHNLQHSAKDVIITSLKGLVGATSTLGALVASLQAEITGWLQVVSLIVGIAVGIVTIWSIINRTKRGS